MGMTAAFVVLSSAELALLKSNEESVPAFFLDRLQGNDPNTSLDIDKSWNGIHFLLNGESFGGDPPFSLPIFGGESVGPELSYGPARYLDAEQVKSVAEALNSKNVNDLKAKFIPSELQKAEVYPTTWERDGEDGFEYLAHYYVKLQSFYLAAATKKQCMLLAII